MRARQLSVVTLVSAIALCGGWAVSATAGSDSVKTKVKITHGGSTHFAGKVTSKESKCEKGRKVTLLYADGGPYKDDVVGSAKTDSGGKWELHGSFTAGLYRAKVSEEEKGSITCRKARGVQLQF